MLHLEYRSVKQASLVCKSYSFLVFCSYALGFEHVFSSLKQFLHFIFKHKSRTKNTISQKFVVPPIINDYSLERQKSHCHSYNLLKVLNRYRSSAKQKVKPFCKALLLTNIFCSFNTTCVELPGDRMEPWLSFCDASGSMANLK